MKEANKWHWSQYRVCLPVSRKGNTIREGHLGIFQETGNVLFFYFSGKYICTYLLFFILLCHSLLDIYVSY